MNTKNETSKHSIGNGAQREKYNVEGKEGYVENPKNKTSVSTENEDDYLEQKWKKIASDFRQKYSMDVSESEFKGNSFSETLKKLENKTGKSRSTLEQEIKNWQNS